MKIWKNVAALALGVAAAGFAVSAAGPAKKAARPKASPLLDRTLISLDGKKVDMRQYQGKVIMIVNTASKCGLTPQYEDLEKIYKNYKDRGFVVLGFPANDFANQEPGDNAEIAQFCSLEYGVTFPMFSKLSVKNPGKHPLYQRLTDPKKNPGFSDEIEWNFAKFLVSREGKVVARFPSRQKPTEPVVTDAIERELARR